MLATGLIGRSLYFVAHSPPQAFKWLSSRSFVRSARILVSHVRMRCPCPYRKSNSNVLMVQSSEERPGNDAANRLDCSRNRCILAQGQVRASLIVISLIRFEQVAKMPLAKYNYIVQAIPPDRADQPFRIAVLPW